MGTRTLSNRIRPCQVPRIPHFERFSSKMSIPSMSGVQTSAVILVFPSGIFCRAITVNSPEIGALVAHFFSPRRIVKYSPSSLFSQIVCCPLASHPTAGSLRQNALSQSFARCGSHSFFCSSLPKSISALHPIDWCALTITAVEPQYFPISSSARL